jgi:predicted transposase YdaD
LCWWDAQGNRLPWRYEQLEKAEIEKRDALEPAKQLAKNETTRQIAKQMLEAHAEIAFIAQVTGLSEDEIKSL